jgi:Transposase DDE domain
MSIVDLLLRTFCFVDDEIKGRKLRQRGPQPRLTDSEVITLQIVGERLGLDRDRQLFRYFRRYYASEFPALRRIHRTTFVRQAANLWHLSLELHQRLVERLLGEHYFWLLDSVAVPVCRLSRANRCRRFRGVANICKESRREGFFYGFRLHLRTAENGMIVEVDLAPAAVSDVAMVEELVPPGQGACLGDRNYWSPRCTENLAQRGWQLTAPFRHASQDPTPERSAQLKGLRQRIETSIGQLTERYHLKRVWARDLWHLTHRVLRKVLSHTLMIWFSLQLGNPPLKFAALVQD